ncbi:MAG: sterol desaturase family protein [Colwellia sp.]|nr:sterol desaturase family protein [Colwellia sp.]
MDFFSSNFKELALYIIDPNQRLFWGYLLSALIFATIVYFINLKNGYKPDSTEEKPRGLIGFLFPRKVFLARSALNDYTLLIANKLFKAALFPFIVLTMVPVALGSSSAIEWVFGPMTPFAWSSTSIMVIFTLMLFIFDDFTRFILHYILHKNSFLWEFHKVHHSATVLTPFTVYRSHPVENYLYACRMALTQGFVVGLCYYLFGPTLKMIDIIGANIFVFAFNIMGSNLRHSHIWISWGDKIESVFLSPAQHQIHHSDNVKHFDKNFGTALSIWDRLFNCNILASEVGTVSFGIGKEGESHKSIISIYTQPFIKIYKKLQ